MKGLENITVTDLIPKCHNDVYHRQQGRSQRACLQPVSTLNIGSCSVSAQMIRKTAGSDISTSPLAPVSEFLKKWLLGKYILVSTCPNGQVDFLSSPHIYV